MSNNNETSPAVQKAMKHFHDKLTEHKVKEALSDMTLADQVRRVVDERDRLFAVASEIVSTLMLERNREYVDASLRSLCASAWLPQIQAIGAGRELSDEELSIALAASGIDITKGLERVQAAIAKYKAKQEQKA